VAVDAFQASKRWIGPPGSKQQTASAETRQNTSEEGGGRREEEEEGAFTSVEKRGGRDGCGEAEDEVDAEAVEESEEVEDATSMSVEGEAAVARSLLILVVGVCDGRRAAVHSGFCVVLCHPYIHTHPHPLSRSYTHTHTPSQKADGRCLYTRRCALL